MANALEALWTAFTEFAPRLLGAGLVLVLTFLVARFLQRLGARLLQRIGFDDLFERTGAASSLQRVGFGRSPSFVFGYVLFWGVLLAGIAAALSILGLASLQRNMDLMVALAGKAVIAVLILAGGLAAAGWLSNLAAAQAEEAGLRGGEIFQACDLRRRPRGCGPCGGGAGRYRDLCARPVGRDPLRHGRDRGRARPRVWPCPPLGKHRGGPLRTWERHTSGG